MASYSHYLSSDNVYAMILGGVAVCRASVSFRRDKLCRDFFRKLLHLIAFIVCCHPLETLKSRIRLEEQTRILDPVTVRTATNLSFITPS